MYKVVAGMTTALLIALAQNSSAAPVQYNFTATNFSAMFLSTAVPQSELSGSYTLDGTALTAFNLAIGSQLYSTTNAGIEFLNASGSYILGGKINGVDGISGFSNDFIFIARPGYSSEFTYSVNGVNDYFKTNNISITSAIAAVPLPSSLPLFASGILSAFVASRRRRAA